MPLKNFSANGFTPTDRANEWMNSFSHQVIASVRDSDKVAEAFARARVYQYIGFTEKKKRRKHHSEKNANIYEIFVRYLSRHWVMSTNEERILRRGYWERKTWYIIYAWTSRATANGGTAKREGSDRRARRDKMPELSPRNGDELFQDYTRVALRAERRELNGEP